MNVFTIVVDDMPDDIQDRLYDSYFSVNMEMSDFIRKELGDYLDCFESHTFLSEFRLTFLSEAHYTWFLLKWA